jgi:purine nucleosidase
MRLKHIFTIFVVLIVSSVSCTKGFNTPSKRNADLLEPVIFIHGGTIDDFVSYLLLTTMEDIDLQAVIVVNADTVTAHAMQIQWKIMDYIKDSNLPVGLSSARGWNPFPWEYRSDAIRHNNIEVLDSLLPNHEWPSYPDGDALLKNLLTEAKNKNRPVSLLITTPLTPLSDLLQEFRDLEGGIGRLIWMGGAIYVDGNLDSELIPAEIANSKAEWNAFWDPGAVDWVLKNTSFPIILFPLDVTDQVPISKEFMQSLEGQVSDFWYSTFVFQSYELTSDEPFYEMWNSVTTVYVSHPEFFGEPVPMNLAIETEGFNQGTISQNENGRPVKTILDIDKKDVFYEYVLKQLRRNYSSNKETGFSSGSLLHYHV